MDSIMQDDKVCYVCGSRMNLQCHHVFGGTANRKKSEQYGLKVWLCYEHHLGKDGVHYNKTLMEHMHKVGQEEFEKTHTREQFRQEFGKSYL